ncbi:hypothetical protein BJV82DRAFT_610008 [Fennellomyces sp. T-0311]|nr:hypothetical protein BJV82DRAFT_610008 [Fennellomyces sp. T-0311]
MTTLPSISNLLNDTRPLSPPPSFQLSPPSPPGSACTPVLSPANSCASLSPLMDDHPMLQGYDPPVRKLSGTPIVAPWSDNVTTPPSPPSPPQPALHYHDQQQQQPPSPAPRPMPPPTTQILISPTTGQPILKRRRGRPPSNREPVNEGGWTFLTPTVWDVKQPPVQHESPEPKTEQHEMMAAFSSSNMDTVLQMPRKKRGRKPKTQLAGNSCFVWKELPSTRSPSKKAKKTKA